MVHIHLPLIHTLGMFPHKNGLNLVRNIEILEYSGSNPFFWSQSINSHKASFSGIAPVETHNKQFIITISGGGYLFKNFQTCLKLNFTWDKACNRFVCACVLWKQKRLSNSRQDINQFKPFLWKDSHFLTWHFIYNIIPDENEVFIYESPTHTTSTFFCHIMAIPPTYKNENNNNNKHKNSNIQYPA